MSDTALINKVAADVIRENATKVFTTKCVACGETLTRSLQWLQEKRFACPTCGGILEDGFLHDLTLSALRKLKTQTPQSSNPKGRKKQHGSVVNKRPSNSKGRGQEYQLVLQFRGDSMVEFDAAVSLEDELADELGGLANVDGHDVGSSETNIFILTSEPETAFDRAKRVLERTNQLGAVTAAYRKVNSDHYAVIWPKGSRKKFAVA